eukprot:5363188-Amphidinium_carterae.1
MEEIFLDMVMTMTTNLTMRTKVADLMIIPMPQCTAGVIYAGRNAFQLRSASGVVLVGRESCMPSA